MIDDEEETNIEEDHSEWSDIDLEITTDDYVWVDESVGFADEKSDNFKFIGYSEKLYFLELHMNSMVFLT